MSQRSGRELLFKKSSKSNMVFELLSGGALAFWGSVD